MHLDALEEKRMILKKKMIFEIMSTDHSCRVIIAMRAYQGEKSHELRTAWTGELGGMVLRVIFRVT